MLELLLNKLTPDSLPLNRIVAFIGPYAAAGEGALASWLLTHLHFLGLFHLTQNKLAGYIGSVVIWALSAGIAWLGRQKWLQGHQAQMKALGEIVSMTGTYEGFDKPGVNALLGLPEASVGAGNPEIPADASTDAADVEVPDKPDQ